MYIHTPQSDPSKPPHQSIKQTNKPNQLKAAREGKLRRARRKRQVDYDKWRAVNHLEAERLLKEGGRVGDWIFRPSGAGALWRCGWVLRLSACGRVLNPFHEPTVTRAGGLSLSWLFLEDTVIHIPVKEEEKGAGDAVGKKLTIGDKVYHVRYPLTLRHNPFACFSLWTPRSLTTKQPP